jgi:hypothetical protein
VKQLTFYNSNDPFNLLTVALELGVYVHREEGLVERTHMNRNHNSLLFRWLLQHDETMLRLDTKTIEPLPASNPPSTSQQVDLTAADATGGTDTTPQHHRTRARMASSPAGHTPQSAPMPLELTSEQFT